MGVTQIARGVLLGLAAYFALAVLAPKPPYEEWDRSDWEFQNRVIAGIGMLVAVAVALP